MRGAMARWCFVAAVVGQTACAETRADQLLAGDPDERFETQRRRANLTWINHTGNVEESIDLFDEAVVTGALHNPFIQLCQDRLVDAEDDVYTVCEEVSPECDSCTVMKELCAASLLLEISGIVAEPMVLTTHTVPRQSLATRTRLQEIAAQWARDGAVELAMKNLQAVEGIHMGVSCSSAEAATTWGPMGEEQSYARTLTIALLDGYELVREATEAAVQGHLDLSDEYFATTPIESEAASLAMASPYQSRSRAAHLLVGGSLGLGGQLASVSGYSAGTDPIDARVAALCTSPDLSPRGRAATALLREVAMDPDRLRGEEIASLVFDHSTDDVRARLQQLWGVTWASDGAFLSEVGLSLADFEEARGRLVQEIDAFGLSRDKQMPARPLATSGMPMSTTLPRYAGTARPPVPAPYLHYASIASYRGSSDTDSDWFTYADLGLAQFIDSVLYWTSLIVLEADAYEDDGLDDDIIDPLALLVGEGQRERPARVQYALTGTNTWEFSVFHDAGYFIDNTDIIIVTDSDNLKCAVDGTIDGEACSVDVYYTPTTSMNPAVGSGFDENATFTLSGAGLAGGRFYVLHGRAPPSGTPAPGAYEQVASGWFGDAGDIMVPSVPLIDEYAAEILAPSQSWCTRSKLSCADTAFDEAIPLEDELSTDSGGATAADLENSWRHYLDLAQQASQEADLLGEQVIDTGLALDMRSEQALSELEDICGAAIDIQGLVSPTLDDAHRHVMGGCDDDGDCMAPEVCRFGQCLRDPLTVAELDADDGMTDPDNVRLLECLGAHANLDFVALGTRSLCFWRNSTGEFCAFNSSENFAPTYPGPRSCPYVARIETMDPEDPPAIEDACFGEPDGTDDDDYEILTVADRLGYFDEPEGGVVGPGGPGPCDMVRRLRAADTAEEAQTIFNDIRGTGYFNAAQMRQLGAAIGWEARFDDFSAVTLDGRPWFGTGDMRTGPSSGAWPCEAPPTLVGGGPDCAAGGGSGAGLFCDFVADDCQERIARATFNQRLGRAVIVARMLTANGYEGIRVPFVPAWLDSGAGAELEGIQDITTAAWMGSCGGSCTSASRLVLSGANDWFGNLLAAEGPLTEYCVASGAGSSWTVFAADGTPTTISSACSGGSQRPFLIYEYGEGEPLAEPTASPSAGDSVLISAAIWHGLSGTADPGCGAFPATRTRADCGRLALFIDGQDGGLPLDENLRFDLVQPVRGYGSGSHVCAALDMTCNFFGTDWTRGYDSNLAFVEPVIGHRSIFETEGRRQARLGEVLDAMELLCEASESGGGGCPTNPPRVDSVADLDEAEQYLHCVANEIEQKAAITVFSDFPARALDALRQESAFGAYPVTGGQYGAAIARLRRALVNLSGEPTNMSADIRSLGSNIRELQTLIYQSGLMEEMADVRFMSSMASQLSACAIAIIDSPSINPVAAATGPLKAAVTCANSIAQIDFASQLARLESARAESDATLAIIRFNDQFTNHVTSLHNTGIRISAQIEEIDAALAEIDTLRRRARRLLSQSMLTSSGPMDIHMTVNAAMQNRHNIARRRYEDAHRDAIRMAFLAQRAIEQRLGLRLAELREDLTLVEAPANWEGSLCTHEGVDYARIRREGTDIGDDFQSPFIGDYVRKLEQVVESYRLDFPFQSGQDTAIVSLRDEIHNVRGLCEVGTSNLLLHSSSLDVSPNAELERGGWAREGCHVISSAEVRNCVVAEQLTTALSAETGPPSAGSANPQFGAARGFRVRFGDPEATCMTPPCCPSSTCGMTSSTALAQSVVLEPGRYRLSWYAKQVGSGPTAGNAMDVIDSGNDRILTQRESLSPDGAWTRAFGFFDLERREEVRVAVVPTSGTVLSQSVDIAAVMLEDVTTAVTAETFDEAVFPPPVYIETMDSLHRPLVACEDTNGFEFRQRVWRRRCVRICSEGFERGCDASGGRIQCFMETQFTLTQSDIEAGRIFHSGGFAQGNYNYRMESIGLNFVGSGTRDCSDSPNPSTCYSAGWIPYSIEHRGPYTVRNHRGDDFEARLFTGHIEHARGLAAERYLTNPLSSADRSVVDPYLRYELRGRPIDGLYILRVWDDPGVTFHGIEDVQLVLNYRYWTRFE